MVHKNEVDNIISRWSAEYNEKMYRLKNDISCRQIRQGKRFKYLCFKVQLVTCHKIRL